MNFHDYQLAASETNQYRRNGPQAAIPPMLGLASETGQVLNVYKNYLRDGVDLKANREFLKEELGDLLWYLTAVATTVGLDMEEIAQLNLQRTHDRYQSESALGTFAKIKPLDDGYPEHERFPRRLVVEFIEDKLLGAQLAASLTIVSADPNMFPKPNQCGKSPRVQRVSRTRWPQAIVLEHGNRSNPQNLKTRKALAHHCG